MRGPVFARLTIVLWLMSLVDKADPNYWYLFIVWGFSVEGTPSLFVAKFKKPKFFSWESSPQIRTRTYPETTLDIFPELDPEKDLVISQTSNTFNELPDPNFVQTSRTGPER